MIDEMNKAIDGFAAKWQKLVAGRADKAFFETLKPTAVGWKAEDIEELENSFREIRDYCDQHHLGWINERWLVTSHLRGQKLHMGIELIKLMQRRPGSSDAVGLDHVDFFIPKGVIAREVLQKESGIKWTEEKNGEFCKWISIWFDGTEAKLRSDTTLDVCIAEMQDINEEIKGATS